MPSVNENLVQWDSYPWERGGEEWSDPWGNAAYQWAITIYPRIMSSMPSERVVEIAPGFGRWTPFLLGQCSRYVGVDISPRAISFCQRAFGRLPQRPQFFVGNGNSLAEIADGTNDLVFSFDSLVHVELDCLTAYAEEIRRVLRPGGHAFLHHSNMAECAGETSNPGWRGVSVSADLAARSFIEAGLQVCVQERTPWTFNGGFTDCFSLLQKPYGNENLAAGRQVYNANFSQEIELAASLAKLYQRR